MRPTRIGYKKMVKLKYFLDNCCKEIIQQLRQKEFDTHDVVFEINQHKELQEEYIKLSEQYGSYNKLNAQIGRYLGNQQGKLGICKNGGKEVSITNTGRQSRNQKWQKIVLCIPFLLLFLSVSSYAQTLTPQQNSKGKWGYVNEKGKAVIKYKYDAAQEFSEDLAVVATIVRYDYTYGKYIYKCGYIDKTGKVIIPLKYSSAKPFLGGLAAVELEYRWGYIDKNGNVVINFDYTDADNFVDGLARVRKSDGRYGFIDKTGKEITPMKYNEVTNFSNGYASVGIERHTQGVGRFIDWGIVDKTGKEILPAEYKEEEVKKMLSDPALMKNEIQRIEVEKQKEIQRKQAEEAEKQRKKEHIQMLIEEAEAALDNDYYTADWNAEEALRGLADELGKLAKDLPPLSEERTHLIELRGALYNAIYVQKMTKKYGAATAKKIMAGKYEIGMTTEMVRDALGNQRLRNNQTMDMTPFYKKSESASSETWSFDWNLALSYGLTVQIVKASGADCPTLVFKNGKLTNIIR